MPPKPVKPLDPNAVKVREVPVRYGPGYDLNAVRPKKKKVKSLENVIPTGIDDGKGAQKLLNSYVKEVCSPEPRKDRGVINFDILSDDFRDKPFLKQLKHVQMKSIPLLSQVARQDALHPTNSTLKKKHYIIYAKNLARDDTALLHARLSSQFLDDSIIAILQNGLQKNTILQHLALHNNAISDEGIEMICMALRWHPTLHTLWLGANRYTDIGARYISQLLMRNKKIKELNISNRWPSEIWQKNEYDLHPHVTYIGAQYLAKSLMRGSGLTSLSLSQQRIRDDGAIYIFEAIQQCNLRALNLSGNELTDRCTDKLRSAFECNSLLEHVVLSNNRIGDDGAINMAYGLARNVSMRCLDVGYNRINDMGLDALFLCLKYNNTLITLITIRNTGSDTRAEDTVASRSSVFSFGGALVSNLTTGPANRSTSPGRGGGSPAGTGAARTSIANRGRKSSVGAGGNNMLSIPLTVADGVQIMGKSVHSKSFRTVEIDSHEASRSNSFRSNSFRALSQNFTNDTDNNDNDNIIDGSDTARSTGSNSPAPMLGAGKKHLTTRERTPPAPKLGGSRSSRRYAAAQATAASAATTSGGVGSPGGDGDLGGNGSESGGEYSPSKPAPALKRNNSSRKFFSFKKNLESEEVKELPSLLSTAPSALANIGRPVRSKDVGKTMSVPNIKNMGVRPVRTSISSQKDSAQHLMYLRISTPFDPPNERPYSILNVAKDYEEHVRRVRALRQDPQYKYDKAFKIHNTPKIIKHQAALPNVPDYFWDNWNKKIRLQYDTGIDNAPGVTSTKLDGASDSRLPSRGDAAVTTSSSADGGEIDCEKVGTGAVSKISASIKEESRGASSKNKQLTLSTGSAKTATLPPLLATPNTTASVGDVLSTQESAAAAAAAMQDTTSAYYMYANDPEQSFRRHLTFKKGGITPGKILAARRKENAIKRAEKLAAQNEILDCTK